MKNASPIAANYKVCVAEAIVTAITPRAQANLALIRCAIVQHFGRRGVVVGQGAGLHVVLQLAATTRSEAEIIERAGQQGIQLLPMSDSYNPGAPDATMLLLGFGGLSAGEIEEGMALLAPHLRLIGPFYGCPAC